MGNGTKVALVALLILMVVMIARFVRDDSAPDGVADKAKVDARERAGAGLSRSPIGATKQPVRPGIDAAKSPASKGLSIAANPPTVNPQTPVPSRAGTQGLSPNPAGSPGTVPAAGTGTSPGESFHPVISPAGPGAVSPVESPKEAVSPFRGDGTVGTVVPPKPRTIDGALSGNSPPSPPVSERGDLEKGRFSDAPGVPPSSPSGETPRLEKNPQGGSSFPAIGGFVGPPLPQVPRGGDAIDSPSGYPKTYVIEKGDSYWRIAEHFYKNGKLASFIEKANPGVKLQPGKKLEIPAPPAVSSQPSSPNEARDVKDSVAKHTARERVSADPASGAPGRGTSERGTPGSGASGYKDYVVQKGDTLSIISKKFYDDPNKFHLIEDANGDLKYQMLQAGAKIKIPVGK